MKKFFPRYFRAIPLFLQPWNGKSKKILEFDVEKDGGIVFTFFLLIRIIRLRRKQKF